MDLTVLTHKPESLKRNQIWCVIYTILTKNMDVSNSSF